ncbi:spore coat polysaccharide biosynthesis protein SpsF [Desulfonatronum zhilinae]|nr:spore coat polysaccharide biosynthesis protein SpsF [Desulfonatronum zhilinae]
MRILTIIQARMSSARYPGKMLAPFFGKPLLSHVVERIQASQISSPVVLATSVDEADTPLALYSKSLDIPVVRGPREDVLGRFAVALHEHPCDAFFRVCGDSPLLLSYLFQRAVVLFSRGEFDLITNVFPRTFPVGMSVELVRISTFLEAEKSIKARDDREHVTRFFYQNSNTEVSRFFHDY